MIVQTKSGNVNGFEKDGLKIFKGIPYAEPPIGPLRFSPPVTRKPWDDVLQAIEFGPQAMQGFNPLETIIGKVTIEKSEADCLTLNIWTPEIDNKKRSVLFWIHGGAFIIGGSSDGFYDGAALAKRGNVVIVSINYRLGALGYLYVPGKTANVGQLDQIEALKWVKNNIESFGGDPGNVTIFGESAGGEACITLLAMPAAKGLFHRAIIQSGPISFDPNLGEQHTKNLMSKCKVEDLKALQELPVKKIIKKQDSMIFKPGNTDLLMFCPRIDGYTLPKHPLIALQEGFASDIEILVGSNENEMKLFTAMIPSSKKMEHEKLTKIITKLMVSQGKDENRAIQLIKAYEDARGDKFSIEPDEISDAIMTDFMFRIPAIRLVEAHSIHQPKTFNYLFTWTSPMMKGKLGACHALELPLLFGTHKIKAVERFSGSGPDADKLSNNLMDIWTSFARTGDPNNENIPKWSPYDTKKRSTMLLGKEIKISNDIFNEERVAWDDIAL